MSTGFELIPLAIAIGVALSKAKEPTEAQVDSTDAFALQTRARDRELLAVAATELDETAAWHDDRLVLTINDVPINLYLPQGADAYEALIPQSITEPTAQAALLEL